MRTSPPPRTATPLLRPALLAFALLGMAAGAAALPPGPAEQARHRQELRSCQDGSSPQTRDSCLREAAAAWAELQRPGPTTLTPSSAAQRSENARRRCQVHEAEDQRAACLRRLLPEAEPLSGSVGGGGLLRQDISHSPAKPMDPPPEPPKTASQPASAVR